MNNGWIKLHRRILNWEWYKNDNIFRVFLHLLLTVNHEEKKWQGIMIKSGQKITSYGHLAEELNLGVQSVRTALSRLKSTDEITIKTTNKYTMITILKWKNYQQLTSKLTINQQSTNNQLTTNKNDKKEKKEKKDIVASSDIPFSLEEEINKLDNSPRRDLKLIGLYFDHRRPTFENKKQFEIALRRHLKPAGLLKEFSNNQILDALDYAKREYKDIYTLDTLIKILSK